MQKILLFFLFLQTHMQNMYQSAIDWIVNLQYYEIASVFS